MSEIHLVVVTPERTTLDEKADFVVLSLFDGEIGILPGHASLIGRLGYGEMRVRVGDKTRRFYVDGGFAQVLENTVSVLTGRCIAAGNIDLPAARQQLQQAEKDRPETSEQRAARDRSLRQARAMIKIAESQ